MSKLNRNNQMYYVIRLYVFNASLFYNKLSVTCTKCTVQVNVVMSDLVISL